MTREEQIRILTEAQERAFKQIELTEGCEMGTEEFARLIDATEQLRWMTLTQEDAPLPDPEKDFAPEQVQPDPVEPETVPEDVQPETSVDEPKFTMVEVRAALAKARSKGVNVAEIVRSFGVESFPEIPEAQYGAVMAKLEGV